MKIMYAVEGDKDVLLGAIISRIGQEVVDDKFPIMPDHVDQYFMRPKRGFGWVEKSMKQLAKFQMGIRSNPELADSQLEFDFIVATVDDGAPNKADCKILAQQQNWVLGISILEFEAWILGDLDSLKEFLVIGDEELKECGVTEDYRPEKDPTPKLTLNKICRTSDWSAAWDSNLSAMLDDEWRQTLNLETLRRNCNRGFKPFAQKLARRMNQELTGQLRIGL